jgi:endonuclease G
VEWLIHGLDSWKYVCRFKARNDLIHPILGPIREDQGFGTGILVGPSLILTVNHVVPTNEEARSCEVVFPGEKRDVSYQLADAAVVCKSPVSELDFTLLRVKRASDGTYPGNHQGYYALRTSEQHRAALYSYAGWLTTIHYAGGSALASVDFRGRSLKLVKERFVAYDAFTTGGSSGAPVFNDSWWLVALHRGKRQQDDEAIKVKFSDEEPERFFKEYAKGVRIDVIIDSVRKSVGREVLSELGLLDN